MKENGLYRKV